MKKIIYSILILCVLALLPRQAMLYYSLNIANNIINTQSKTEALRTEKEDILALSSYVSEYYIDKKKSASKDKSNLIIGYLQFLQPYITNHRLPPFIRMPIGSVELVTAQYLGIGKGQCDSAARMLINLLQIKGYKAHQLNMFTKNRGGHSAVELMFHNREKGLIDPYFSGIAFHNDKFVSANQLQILLKSKVKIEDLFLSYNNDPMIKIFYQNFDKYKYVYQGSAMTINIKLPKGAFVKEYSYSELNPYLFYMGVRYDRSWTRSITTDLKVKIEFILNKEVDASIIKSNLDYKINGNVISWVLEKNESLLLYDKNVPLRLIAKNNYQRVNKIRITHMKV